MRDFEEVSILGRAWKFWSIRDTTLNDLCKLIEELLLKSVEVHELFFITTKDLDNEFVVNGLLTWSLTKIEAEVGEQIVGSREFHLVKMM